MFCTQENEGPLQPVQEKDESGLPRDAFSVKIEFVFCVCAVFFCVSFLQLFKPEKSFSTFLICINLSPSLWLPY